jgi:starch-binding outer membrane protein, SusD/RagB family
MKKPPLLLVSVILFTILNTCSEDFLVREPMGILSENILYTEKGIDALLTGTYALAGGSSLYDVTWGASIQNWIFGSVASDDAYTGSESTGTGYISQIEEWNVFPDNTYPADKWKWAYMGIYRANILLDVIEKASGINTEKASVFKAETLFLRALFYFEARLVFGDFIPVISATKNSSAVSNLNQKGVVLAFIINDLKYAWENLPDFQSQPGRATKYAAMALAARAYLQDLDYGNAKPLLDSIINSGRYNLMPNYFDNFRIEKENNAESIFEIQANVNDIEESLNAEMGIGLNFPHGSDIGMCCGFHQTSQNLANAFKVDENGLPLFDTFDDIDLKNDQGIKSEEEFIPASDLLDPRIDWTVGRRGIPYLDWGIMRGYDWIRHQRDGGPYMPALKPFFYKSQRYELSTTSGWMAGVNANNYRYLRYAHVLLWRAEAAAVEGDLEKARELVNLIRARAANEVVMGKVLAYTLPAELYPWGEGTSDADYQKGGIVDWLQPAANYKIGLYAPFASIFDAMRAVQWEQRLEFATEGRRFFDLRRWDGLPGKIGGKSMAEVLYEFAQNDLRIRHIMQEAFFHEKDKYQPVPRNIIEAQPGVIVQRPEYK